MLLSTEKRKAIIADALRLNGKKGALQESWDSRTYPEICRNELFRGYLHDAGHLITVPPELKEALDHFDNPSVLGESTALITRFPFMATRIEQQKALSAATRGRVIQNILHEALENMSGQGKRNDEARDWVHYNILHYRYFNQKQDLKQEIVASRLLISDRQYYRLFHKAIELLWKQLVEMDATETLGSG